jgi:phage terminase large subunit
MNTYRRDLGIRARPARKGRMRKLSYEWLANLREIVIDSERCLLTYAELVNKAYLRDREGNWLDEISDGQDHDAIRHAMMDDVLRG